MITPSQKQDIARILNQERIALGGWQKVATKVGANVATVSLNMQNVSHYDRVSDNMWIKVAARIGYKLTNTAWTLVETTNTRYMTKYLADAQQQSMFLAVSHKAGQGKSASVELYRASDETGAVFTLECEESWSHKLFLSKLCQTLGVDASGSSTSAMTDLIVEFFKRKATESQPLLILDEANKLKPASLRLIIPLYNKLKGDIGLVIVGADDLEKHIKAGVRRNVRGYDELDSRLGRKFMHLIGATERDVRAICAANGITDAAVQEDLWLAMNPRQELVGQTYTALVQEDLRRLERLIMDRRMKTARA